nr:response regulator [uncultured Tolumonas sp.]
MRLLLAEDDTMIGQGLRDSLRKEEFSVDWVQDGKAVLLSLETNPYSLVLLDLGLPKLDGMDVLQQLRKKNLDVAVIIITARDGLPERLAGLNLGADDYLVKPFATEELIARIRTISRRLAGRTQNDISVGRLRLDPIRHELWVNDEPINVSAREFKLLHELMIEPGRVISREQLEDRLYGWGEEIASNAIEVYISHLRKKIGAEVIQTIRGVGYRIGSTL